MLWDRFLPCAQVGELDQAWADARDGASAAAADITSAAPTAEVPESGRRLSEVGS